MRELARLIDTQLNAVRREIANLERLGILAAVPREELPEQEGGTERSKFYRLQSDSLLFTELKALLVKAEIMEERELIKTITERGGEIKLFFLTGAFTHDTEVSTDMLIVGSVKPMLIAKLIRAFEGESGRTIRYTLMTEKEFRDRRELGDKFLYSVFEAKHLPVVNEYNVS